MSTKTLRVCDAPGAAACNEEGVWGPAPCNLPFTFVCCLCGGDRCTKHSGEELYTRAYVGNLVVGVVGVGGACQSCTSSLGDIEHTRDEIKPLLETLNEPIVLVIRAAMSARVLKDEKK